HMPRGSRPSSPATRSRISPAALFVKVTARMCSGGTPCSCTRWQMRVVSTRVLPDPAPASTSSGPSTWSVASSCSGFSPSRCAAGGASGIRHGEADLEGRALPALEQLDAAAVHALDDAPGERQAHAPAALLRAHARLEDPVPDLGVHARTGISDTNAHPGASDFPRID